MTYTVIYGQGPATWGAYVPDLPGVAEMQTRARKWKACSAKRSSFT
jgi:hypothetical protein